MWSGLMGITTVVIARRNDVAISDHWIHLACIWEVFHGALMGSWVGSIFRFDVTSGEIVAGLFSHPTGRR